MKKQKQRKLYKEKYYSLIFDNDTRNIYKEINYFSLLKEGLWAKTECGDWEVKLDESYNLLLASVNTSIDLSKPSIDEAQKLNNIELKFQGQSIVRSYIIRNSIITRQSAKIDIKLLKETNAHVFEMICTNYGNLSKFRTIIPYNKRLKELRFSLYFKDCISIYYDDVHQILCGISLTYNDVQFNVYNYDNNSNKYIVIEAINYINYDEYISASNKILNVIGFFTTIYPFGPYMIFDCETIEPTLVAYNNCLAEPRIAKYQLLILNPYDYFLKEDIHNFSTKVNTNITTLKLKIKAIEKKTVKKLLVLLDDNRFLMMFFAFQEISTNTIDGNSNSVLTDLKLYASCLEVVASWFNHSIEDEKKQQSALFSDEVRKNIQKDFLEILEKYKDCNEKDIEILKNKIKGYLFTIPNADNLSKPFEYYGVKLNEEDKKSLKLRNQILHGANIIKAKFDRENVIAFVSEAEQYCFGYYSLIWRLIMRIIGYDGKYYLNEVEKKIKYRYNQSNNGEPFIKEI